MTREEADEPICAMPPNVDELRKWFEAEEDPSLGAWNGIDGSRATKFICQTGSSSDRRVFPNSVEMPFSPRDEDNVDLITVSVLKPVLLGLVAAWDPDRATLYSVPYMHRLHEAEEQVPLFRSGRMTYLSLRYALRITPPAAALVERTPGGGLLMLATEEPFTVKNPEHVAVADAIQACLAPLQR